MAIQLHQTSTAGIEELLADYEVGTPGKARYKLLNVPDKLPKLNNPYFFSLEKRDRTLGTVCFCQREVKVSDATLPAYYVRYFSLHEAYRTSQKSERLTKKKRSSIKSEIVDLLSHSLDPAHDKALYYAYVELNNERSRNLCDQFGFRPIRSFQTIAFSRFSPQKDIRASKLKGEDRVEMLARLEKYYAQHNLFFSDHFDPDSYFVLKEQGRVVAGVQARPAHWQITYLPGLEGKLAFQVLPRIPFLAKIFRPDFEFIALDTIYVEDGYEKLLPNLFESICFELNYNSCLLWLDIDNHILPRIRRKLGLLSKFHTSSAQIVVKTLNLSEAEEESLKTRLAYISAFDLI